MDETGQNRYVAQLKEEFDSCDTTGTGYLDKEELTALCHKLNLDAHLPLLLDVLLGPQHYARVHFEEFKEGFVAVLSGSLDLSTSEEESSYLEPVPGEVSPKFVKGTKRYGRRSRPDKTASTTKANTENLPPFNTEQDVDTFMGVRRAKLRRSTSLESVESLKSDDDTGSNKVTIEEQSSSQNSVHFEAQGQLKLWKPSSSESQKYHSGPCQEVTDGQVKAIWEELGVGAEGSLNKQELSKVCNHIGLKDLQTEELDALFSKLDKDHDGRVSLIEFQKGLFRPGDLHAPTAASTPVRLNTQHPLSQAFEEHVVRSTSPSLLSATVSQRLLSRLDDGSGCTSPERVVAAWTEEGIRNSRDILRTLDFSMEERLSLAELSLALDNELLVSGNGIHQAALISYKDEIQFLQMLANQAGLERDKIKADLELADRRNLQLVREIDDRHATMESLNESKIKDLEQGYREKLCALRSETEQENEVLLQQLEIERDNLKDEVEILRAQEAGLQREVNTAIEEYSRLEEENCSLKNKLSESESTIAKLKELNHVLQDKCDGLDVNSTGLLSNEERLSGIIKEYEQRCRELQDQNDELSSELEILKNQGSTKKTRRSRERFSTHTWSSRRILVTDSDSDDPEIKKSLSPQIKKQSDKNDLGSLESLTPSVSIETELAMEQLKERYEQNVQDLKIQLETKVNFYERTIELMKQNIEIERKEIAQSYKLEISELEEQKILVEEQAEQLRQAVKRLEGELRIKSEVVARGPEQERRAQREQAELEQNFAREIGNIVHRLTSEKDQLEAELTLKMNQEMLLVRKDTDQQISQMKAQFSKAQRNLLHQLHGERVRLQQQTEQHSREMGEWESRVQELDQEVHKEHLLCAEQLGEERAKNCNSTVLERNKVDEEYQREISQLKECICRIQIQAELQFKAEQKSVVLQRQLEEKLEEMCVQLEDNTVSMKAQDALIHNLTSELNAKEKEMDNKKENEQKLLGKVSELQRKVHFEKERNLSQQKVVKNKEAELLSKLSELEQRLVKYTKREQELLDKLSQFEQELESMRSESDMLQKEKKQDQENHDRLSTTVDRQQMRLNEQDMELDQLREQLEKIKDAQKNANEHLTKQLKSVEEDRNRLMQEITSQNVELEDLQAQCQKLSGDWKQLNRVVQNLQSDLNQEQAIVTQLKARLKLQQEEKNCLLQEKSSYSHLSDQLSAQIMEMEAESNKLTENLDSLKLKLQNRDSKLEDLRTELDAKAKEMDLLWNKVHQELETTQDVNHLSGEVQLLTSLLKDKDKELSSLRQELDTTNQLHQSLIDSKADVQHLKEVFDEEKGRMTQQLLEMEKLVIDLETVMDPASPHRAKMDEVSSENGALEDRLAVLHQDIVTLEEDVSKKRKKLEEMEKENVKLKQEQMMLHKENAKSRKEVLELSDRNLQLSDENSELNSRLQSDQGTVQMLTEKLAEECQEQEKMAVSVKQLQERSSLLEKEKLLIRITKQEEQNILEKELKEAQNKLQRFTEVESALTSLTVKNQSLQQEKEGLLKESEESKQKIEKLQDCIKSLEAQTIQLHSQIYSICKEKDAQIEVIGKNHSMLKESQDKVVALEARMHELGKEKEQLHLVHRVQEQAAASVFQEQLKSTQVLNQELLEKVKGFETKLLNQEFELQRLKHDNKALKNQHGVLEAIKYEAEQQILRANTALSLSRAQHLREVQQLKDQVGTDAQKQLAHLHTQLAEQQKKVQQQEEQLHFEVQQSRTQLKLQQEQYENMIESTHEQMDEVKSKLKMAHLMLQEKVNQLKEQFLKNAKSDLLMKDLYVENSQLMKALQITEQRQKSAEKKSFVLEEKVTALNKLLCKIAPISLTA